MSKKTIAAAVAGLSFLAITGAALAQTATPSPSPSATPSSTTTVPSGAPSTGHGG